jgi:hypothetical protein
MTMNDIQEAGLRLATIADLVGSNLPPSKREQEQRHRRTIRLAFEAGRISFVEMLAAYEGGLDLGDEVENDSYFEDGRQWVPVREDWHTYEDHGFRAITSVGDVLAFGGVA